MSKKQQELVSSISGSRQEVTELRGTVGGLTDGLRTAQAQIAKQEEATAALSAELASLRMRVERQEHVRGEASSAASSSGDAGGHVSSSAVRNFCAIPRSH